MPHYDTVLSLGGQSLIDGIWHILGPSLEELSNPLPITLPGFTNATMRITQLVPALSGPPGKFAVHATLVVEAEVLLLLKSNQDTGGLIIPTDPLSSTDVELTNLTGPLLGTLSGKLSFPNGIKLPAVPLPTLVAVNLTPTPLTVPATLTLSANGISSATGFSISVGINPDVSVGDITLDPAVADNLTTILTNQSLIEPSEIPAIVAALVTPQVASSIKSALQAALQSLQGESGRLIYPPIPAGTNPTTILDAFKVLPNFGDAVLTTNSAGNYVLQLGFGRGSYSTITALPAAPNVTGLNAVDTSLLISNRFVLELLCILLQRLPAFTLPASAQQSAQDVLGQSRQICFNFRHATVDFNFIALTGGISICLDEPDKGSTTKQISLVGSFDQHTDAANFFVTFNLPLLLDLDDVASITNLRMVGTPTVNATVLLSAYLNNWLIGIALGFGAVGLVLTILSFIPGLGGLGGPGTAAIVIGAIIAIILFVLNAACSTIGALFTNSVRTILRDASAVSSPPAVPVGVFEALGKLVPSTIEIDDLTAKSVLQSPTQPWTLLSRRGRNIVRPIADPPIPTETID